MQVVFIYGKTVSSALCRFFTGSTCFHVGFTDGIHFWDMNLIRRRRFWADYRAEYPNVVVDAPVEITAQYLDNKLDTDNSRYGVIDYLLFGLRGVYHLFGSYTRNAGGVICSEMVFNDLVANGWNKTFREVPSPADLELALLGRLNAIDPK
jgi:hypothetical protein